ncbi:hypothetical protein BU23DRAFT_38538 [Bimuria novae-zelandiae CBS 107.79]|uniref:Uncharacterized protein n=1 Tax=Bimuria novae-zelandiae CBS 107.79 TaxID=1447943 RepID=A0A6A5UJD8_9PLEO|nr:hypothetical protein BU23DRAFT_38538 [Bimuria novae-zelandiae CBS 107.79]
MQLLSPHLYQRGLTNRRANVINQRYFILCLVLSARARSKGDFMRQSVGMRRTVAVASAATRARAARPEQHGQSSTRIRAHSRVGSLDPARGRRTDLMARLAFAAPREAPAGALFPWIVYAGPCLRWPFTTHSALVCSFRREAAEYHWTTLSAPLATSTPRRPWRLPGRVQCF